MTLLAHIGHWWMYPLYGLPVLIVLASVVASTLRERRARREAADSSPGA